MKRKYIDDKIMEIMALSIKISNETDHDVTCCYYGSVESLTTLLFLGGFDVNKNYSTHPDCIEMKIHLYKSDDEIMAEFDECIDTLNRFYESR